MPRMPHGYRSITALVSRGTLAAADERAALLAFTDRTAYFTALLDDYLADPTPPATTSAPECCSPERATVDLTVARASAVRRHAAALDVTGDDLLRSLVVQDLHGVPRASR